MDERGDIIRTEDYIHAMREFAKRIDTTAATLSADRIAADIPHKPLTSDDCVPDSQHTDWEGKTISILELSKAVHVERDNNSKDSNTTETKPTLMEKLDEGKRRAARQGQPDTQKNQSVEARE